MSLRSTNRHSSATGGSDRSGDAAIEAAGGEEKVPELLRAHVGKEIGPIAKPKRVLVVTELPKTRSGKIMRRILRKIAENAPDQLGDTTTLADPSVVESLVRQRRGAGG